MEQPNDTDLSEWKGEHWSIVGPSWPGFGGIKHLIIFGDSYSQTACLPQKAPTVEEPLGAAFPGTPYTEGGPNWVGHLVNEHKPPILVHNYARGGATVVGVGAQVSREFAERHPPAMPWTSRDSLFVTWVGINDLACSPKPQQIIDLLFGLENDLYKKGVRNFLFIDVPPVDRSPAYKASGIGNAQERFLDWNAALGKAIHAFVNEKSTTGDPVTVIYFSSHKVFTAILEDPKIHGFPKKDAQKSGGAIWMDHLHPTSAVHLILSNEMETMLASICAFVPLAADES